MVLGHGYAHPSYCFKFILDKKKMNSSISTKDYCYHGTSVALVNKIVNESLQAPNGWNVKARNGTYSGKSIYTTKIPEHAQVFADPYEWKGKYFQILFLVRQDLSKVDWVGPVDTGSKYANELYQSKECYNLNKIHLLHSNLLK